MWLGLLAAGLAVAVVQRGEVVRQAKVDAAGAMQQNCGFTQDCCCMEFEGLVMEDTCACTFFCQTGSAGRGMPQYLQMGDHLCEKAAQSKFEECAEGTYCVKPFVPSASVLDRTFDSLVHGLDETKCARGHCLPCGTDPDGGANTRHCDTCTLRGDAPECDTCPSGFALLGDGLTSDDPGLLRCFPRSEQAEETPGLCAPFGEWPEDVDVGSLRANSAGEVWERWDDQLERFVAHPVRLLPVDPAFGGALPAGALAKVAIAVFPPAAKALDEMQTHVKGALFGAGGAVFTLAAETAVGPDDHDDQVLFRRFLLPSQCAGLAPADGGSSPRCVQLAGGGVFDLALVERLDELPIFRLGPAAWRDIETCLAIFQRDSINARTRAALATKS